jgi:transcriptional regulator with XRE-family HTH domain
MDNESDPKKQFGQVVREFRQKRGLSQGDLGDLAHLDRSYISDIERGLRNVSLVNIIQIAKALGVRPADLMQNLS